MSSIQKFIRTICVQDAVYWGNPQNNGEGGKTFDVPVEIKCRWEDIELAVEEKNGKIIESRSRVLLTQDVDEEGFLYLGTLDSLLDSAESSDVTLNPLEIEHAYEIKRVFKVPELKSSTDFIITAYLGTAFI